MNNKTIFLWDKKSVKNIISKIDDVPEYALLKDDSGKTILLFLINNNHHTNKTLQQTDACGTYTKKHRNYTYNPNTLKTVILLSDLQAKDAQYKTCIDYLFLKCKEYDVHAYGLRDDKYCKDDISEYPCWQDNWSIKHILRPNHDYHLFKWLLSAVQQSGYNYANNPQTTLELLDKGFNQLDTIKSLISQGIECGTTFNYFDSEEIETLRYKIMQYERNINNDKELQILLKQEFNPKFLHLLFERAISRNEKNLIHLLYKKEPKYFIPILGFKVALYLNQSNSLWYILKSFNRLTLHNLITKSRTKNTLCDLYEQENKNCHLNFLTKCGAIAVLRNYRFDTYEWNKENKKRKKFKQLMPLDVVSHIIEYLP